MAAFHATDADKNFVHGAMVLNPKPESLDEVVTELNKLAEQVEANEPDTLVFSVAKSAPVKELGQEGPEQIVVSMVFKSREALESHRNTDYNKALTESIKSKLSGPPEARALTPTGGFMRKPPQ